MVIRIIGIDIKMINMNWISKSEFNVLYFVSFQKQAMLVRQLEEEVVKTRAHAKETQPEIKHHIEGLQMENDHLTREVAILKETTKVFFSLILNDLLCIKNLCCPVQLVVLKPLQFTWHMETVFSLYPN